MAGYRFESRKLSELSNSEQSRLSNLNLRRLTGSYLGEDNILRYEDRYER